MDPIFFLGITVIVLLVAIFIVSYVLNHKTPVPEGCESINISEEFCLQCGNKEWSSREKFDLDKIKRELEEENKEDK